MHFEKKNSSKLLVDFQHMICMGSFVIKSIHSCLETYKAKSWELCKKWQNLPFYLTFRYLNTRFGGFFQNMNFTGFLFLIKHKYSLWDRLRNFLLKSTWIVLSVHKLNKLGKFWLIYGQLLNTMSIYGWYEKRLRRSHNYLPVHI